MQVHAFLDELGVMLVLPEGRRDDLNYAFWSSTSACCGSTTSDPHHLEDATYIRGLAEHLLRKHPTISRLRVYAWGFSNGGFQSLRMACLHADLFAAVASTAGAHALDRSASSHLSFSETTKDLSHL
jgi:poly(3-hydroxybutyrate) depolymerase